MKAKVSVSQQGQDWEAPKANDLKLAIPVYLAHLCPLMHISCTWYTRLKTTRNKSILPPG